MHRTCATGNALLIAILLATSMSAAAADRDWNVYGWIDEGSTQLQANNSETSQSSQGNKRQPALGIGVRWTSGLNIEAGHVRKLRHTRYETTFDNGIDQVTFHFDDQLDSTFLLFGWSWPVGGGGWSLTAQGGAHRSSSHSSYRGDAARYDIRNSRHDLSYGIRADYALNERWHIGLGVQRFVFDSLELDRTALRVSYQF